MSTPTRNRMPQNPNSVWSVYLLSDGSRTYVGSTTDPTRRLRQHNGEIRGGARATRGRKWWLVCYVSGFDGRGPACRWEKLVKGRARGVVDRSAAMALLPAGICPLFRNRPLYEVPTGLEIHYA